MRPQISIRCAWIRCFPGLMPGLVRREKSIIFSSVLFLCERWSAVSSFIHSCRVRNAITFTRTCTCRKDFVTFTAPPDTILISTRNKRKTSENGEYPFGLGPMLSYTSSSCPPRKTISRQQAKEKKKSKVKPQ
jgi:hypothetical protein